MLLVKMNSLAACPRGECLLVPISSSNSTFISPPNPFPQSPARRRAVSRISLILSALKTSTPEVGEFAEGEVLQTFLRERELNGDFIAKVSDRIWLRDLIDGTGTDIRESDETQLSNEFSSEESEGGFLKLARTKEWLSGDVSAAPTNRKLTLKELRDDRERRKRLNLLKYEALKRELLLLTVGIGTACGGYCLIVFSVQAALSYATGVLFSCLYLQLLCQHADNLSKENVPQIFRQKKLKKIGIRSEDLKDFFERSVKGSSIALSSPRLVIPAAIYGVWELSQHFTHDIFDFKLAPAMLGLFAYKAAALVQVYRDNEDLQFIFPNDGGEERSP